MVNNNADTFQEVALEDYSGPVTYSLSHCKSIEKHAFLFGRYSYEVTDVSHRCLRFDLQLNA